MRQSYSSRPIYIGRDEYFSPTQLGIFLKFNRDGRIYEPSGALSLTLHLTLHILAVRNNSYDSPITTDDGSVLDRTIIVKVILRQKLFFTTAAVWLISCATHREGRNKSKQ